MIWYSVDIKCDAFFITSMKSRDADTNLKARAAISIRSFWSISGGK